MSLAGRILDIYDDPGASLLKQASDDGLTPPLYVLAHRLPVPAPDLPDELYAYVDRSSSGVVRKYACSSKATTWINGLYFLKLGSAFPPKIQQQIATRLSHFYDLYDVPKPDLLQKIAQAQDTVPIVYEEPSEPVTEDVFALTRTSREPKYPIATWEHIKQAQEYFMTNWQVLPVLQRREFCVKVAERVRALARQTLRGQHEPTTSLSKAASLDIKARRDPIERLPELMELYASETPCEKKIALSIGERIKTMEKRNQHALAETYRELYLNRGSYTVDKFAEALARMDDASGLDSLYGKRLVDPYLSVLKLADDPRESVIYDEDGISLTRNDLQRFRHMKSALLRRFDSQMVEELVTDPEAVFPSLPRPERQALAALLK